jgi:serine/threonine protein phosphatase PrpC
MLDIVSLTHPGMVRARNEDSHVVDAANGFAILADGMGGYKAGEVASAMAVTLLAQGLGAGLSAVRPKSGLDRTLLIKTQIEQANAAIHDAAQAQPQCAGMGATLVSAIFEPGCVTVAHVGDSRLYRARGARFDALTRDHSLLQEQIDGGLISPEEALISSNRNLVTRALGMAITVEVEVAQYETLPGDIYLLCSDGLNDMVAHECIGQVLSGAHDLGPMAQQLVALANANGGHDNITVILVRMAAQNIRRGLLQRIRASVLRWCSAAPSHQQ